VRRRGLTRQEVNDLQEQIPARDVVAEKAGLPTHHGRIEALEEAYVPWLRARRKRRRIQREE
jgi:IS5 family transposase